MKKHTLAKKMVTILLAGAMLATLAACGGDTGGKATTPPAVGSTAPAPSGGALNAADIKVALVCGGAINDGGWNAAANEGLERIKSELGCETAVTEKVAVAEMPQVLRTYARQGFTLVFGHGAEFGEPMSTVAPEFPEVTFIAVNASVEGDNLSGTVFKFGENGYFCGMAAALVSESGKIGIIPPDDAPNNKADMETYELGAKAVNPDIEVFTAYTGSWTDLPKAKEAADSLISKGCDVLLSMGDAYSVGVFQACESAGVKAIGWVSDQKNLSENVICSGLQSVGDVYVTTTKRFLEGSMEHGVQIYGMKDGAQGISELYGLNEEQAKQVKDAVQSYLDGKLEIPTLY